MSYLRLHRLVKSYDGRVNAVDDISVEIARGEFLTFLGPSGSGKTTTLMMIAGFEEPTSGVIALAGEDLTRRKPYERNVGVVFQNYALFPHMTVARNVAFPLRMRGFPRGQQAARVRDILTLVGLSGYAERYPRELSGGQQQRVALARGLVFNPDVLLLDEPLGALDKNLREQMQVELKRIHREVGITMVYVTHDQTEAMTMSDRIAVFNHGTLEQVAPPLEVYHRPRTRFVGEFIGDSNFFIGTLDSAHPGRVEVDGLGPIQVDPEACRRIGGGRVDVLVRPERVQLAGLSAAATVPEVLSMKITVIVNYGDSVLVIGDARGQTVRMRIAGAQPEAIREGATVTVGWAPGDAHLIPRVSA
ncbi:MAG: polyamine ABC transporter ATP-binding protein [Candidatus Rokuibacteriota bacterium]|nr:MAG: polyamine ABC transporter ATP-binding protein [Candidatus Rokubacteria bacterium]